MSTSVRTFIALGAAIILPWIIGKVFDFIYKQRNGAENKTKAAGSVEARKETDHN